MYKATLETITGQDEELRMVAVKKLKTNATALSSCLQDFEREINIMKVRVNFRNGMMFLFSNMNF